MKCRYLNLLYILQEITWTHITYVFLVNRTRQLFTLWILKLWTKIYPILTQIIRTPTTRKWEIPDVWKPSGKTGIPSRIWFLTVRQELADRSPLSGKVHFSCRLADRKVILSVVPDGKTVRKVAKKSKKNNIHTSRTAYKISQFTLPTICTYRSHCHPSSYFHKNDYYSTYTSLQI